MRGKLGLILMKALNMEHNDVLVALDDIETTCKKLGYTITIAKD